MSTTPRLSRARYSGLLVAFGAVISACDLLTGDSEERVTLYVAAQTQTCFGPFDMQCLLVKERPVLLITWREISNPPAEGSSRAYRLIELRSKTPG